MLRRAKLAYDYLEHFNFEKVQML
ncbi:hypothetical protein KL86DES1_22090 [uncultured Desulfovibrio sp.]|uniref:Uncharacterized protein n=1 Tax=uncultured Desulfovibrio sp. TaxID=167968 RepID=A0A212LAT6_9BACT|nr:hypothetical protein KL86DES1_22090 [uncultured Desulfovibrio sp.]VZH34984.1 conserved protein of unknown function [Desulfovibrio sp. 86]